MEREITYITYRELTLEFLKFLKKHNALKPFKQNVLRTLKRQCSSCITQYTMVNPFVSSHILPYEYNSLFGYAIIDQSFVWAATPQGHDYWHELDLEWDNYVRKKNFRLKIEQT